MLRGHIREIDVGENSRAILCEVVYNKAKSAAICPRARVTTGCDRYRMHRSMRETKDQSLPTHDNRRRMHNDGEK